MKELPHNPVFLSAAKDLEILPQRSPAGFFTARKRAGEVVRLLAALPAKPLLALIWIYQRVLSPSIPAMFGPTISCRYYPTCSHYAAESLRTHGVLLGLFFAVRRLLRCTPFHSGGIDLVPAPGVMRRVCQRVRTTHVSA